MRIHAMMCTFDFHLMSPDSFFHRRDCSERLLMVGLVIALIPCVPFSVGMMMRNNYHRYTFFWCSPDDIRFSTIR